MKTFLLKDKKPIVRWGSIPHHTYFEGNVPEGYNLAVCPHDPYIILDVDVHNEKSNGFDNIPKNIEKELNSHFSYDTKSGGRHYWLYYTGIASLKNKSTKFGLDLRTSKGYVKWNSVQDPKNLENLVGKTSKVLNEWLEELFS